MSVDSLWTISQAWLLSSGIHIIVILILTLITLRLSRLIIARSICMYNEHINTTEAIKRSDTLNALLRSFFRVIILSLSTFMIIKEFGIDIRPILATAGILGLAVGFGAQKLVADIISGFFIFLENQICVGDVVQVAGKGGFVERVTLRMVILRDLAGNVHYVRNGEINIVTNMTKEYSRYVFDIRVSYNSDVDHVMRVIQQVDEDMRTNSAFVTDILEPIEILGLDQFTDSALSIKARTKTQPIKQWAVAREFNRRLKIAFDQEGIKIPFPHRTLCFSEPLSIQKTRS